MCSPTIGARAMKLSNWIKIRLTIYFLALLLCYLAFRSADVTQDFPYQLTVLHVMLVAPVAILLFLSVFPWLSPPGIRLKLFRDLPYSFSIKNKAGYMLGCALLMISPYFTFLEEADQNFWKQEVHRLKEMQDQ